MIPNLNHRTAVEEFFQLGKKLGFIPVKEYSFENFGELVDGRRADLVWIGKNGKICYFFEFETTHHSGKNTDKIIYIMNVKPETKDALYFQFYVYKTNSKAKVHLMNSNDWDFFEERLKHEIKSSGGIELVDDEYTYNEIQKEIKEEDAEIADSVSEEKLEAYLE